MVLLTVCPVSSSRSVDSKRTETSAPQAPAKHCTDGTEVNSQSTICSAPGFAVGARRKLPAHKTHAGNVRGSACAFPLPAGLLGKSAGLVVPGSGCHLG